MIFSSSIHLPESFMMSLFCFSNVLIVLPFFISMKSSTWYVYCYLEGKWMQKEYDFLQCFMVIITYSSSFMIFLSLGESFSYIYEKDIYVCLFFHIMSRLESSFFLSPLIWPISHSPPVYLWVGGDPHCISSCCCTTCHCRMRYILSHWCQTRHPS